MGQTAISASHITKRYSLGSSSSRNDTMRDVISNALFFWKRWGHRRTNAGDSDDFYALRDVSFEIEHGEVLGIIGGNGAGKSTLLKILSNIVEPTSGEVNIYGRVASLLEVGTGFHPELTGRENIYLNGAILGMTKKEIKGKFDEIVQFAEIDQFIDTPVKRYSSGMYVRLAFAVAANLESDILIVDEVLAVGDAYFQKKCLGKMSDVGKSGRTVLLVSHNMGAIRQLSSKCLVLDKGSLVFTGDVDKAISLYLKQSSEQVSSSVLFDDVPVPGSREMVIKSVALRNGFSSERTSEFSMGEPFVVEIETEAAKEGVQYYASIHIFNEYGIGVYHLTLIDDKNDYFSSDIRGRIMVEMDMMKLYPGRYTIDVYIGTKWVPLDHKVSAIAFEVNQTRGLLIARTLVKGMGIIHEPVRWHYEKL
ncbi:MAG: ABC transporter ATP-binding protein [Bacteroidota bacterium]